MSVRALIDGLELRPDQAAAVGEGAFDGEQVLVEFLTQGDAHVRPAHAALHGTVWRADDPNAPAPPLDFGCFLPGTTVEGFFDGASRAFYSGEAVEVLTKGGLRLRVTPNHPIPTEHGIVAAGALKPGRKLGRYIRPNAVPAAGQRIDEQHEPALVENVFHALAEHGGVSRARNSGHEFHGDAHAIHGEIEVVGSYGILWRVWESEFGEERRKLPLARGHVSIAAPSVGLSEQGGAAGLASLEFDGRNSVGLGDLCKPLFDRHAGPFDGFRFGLAAKLSASGQESLGDGSARDAESLGYRIDGLPLLVHRNESGGINWRQMQCLRFGKGAHLDARLYESGADGLTLNPVFLANLARLHASSVELDDVLEVRRFDYSGHVYDLRSPCGYVIADGAFASNCRCQLRYVAKPKTLAAHVFPVAEAVPLPRAEVFAAYLDKRVPEWPKVAAAAAKAPPAERLDVAYLTLKKLRPDLGGDTRDLARMAVEAGDMPAPRLPAGADPSLRAASVTVGATAVE